MSHCELCGEVGVGIRPYGPNGEWICTDCGDLDKVSTFKRASKLICGKEVSDEEAVRGADLVDKISVNLGAMRRIQEELTNGLRNSLPPDQVKIVRISVEVKP